MFMYRTPLFLKKYVYKAYSKALLHSGDAHSQPLVGSISYFWMLHAEWKGHWWHWKVLRISGRYWSWPIESMKAILVFSFFAIFFLLSVSYFKQPWIVCLYISEYLLGQYACSAFPGNSGNHCLMTLSGLMGGTVALRPLNGRHCRLTALGAWSFEFLLRPYFAQTFSAFLPLEPVFRHIIGVSIWVVRNGSPLTDRYCILTVTWNRL